MPGLGILLVRLGAIVTESIARGTTGHWEVSLIVPLGLSPELKDLYVEAFYITDRIERSDTEANAIDYL